ncbi:MAG TPA: TrmH family RNA methyltransferase [Vicinamibacteria bacterium]
MDPSRVEIVLVRPSRPANVAAACRAMKNMGLATLWIVGAEPGQDDASARGLAYGAWDVLDGARRAPSLEDAVAGSGAVVGTSALDVERAWTPRRLAAEAHALAGGRALSLVFGPEATGLTAAERDLCHVLVRVPSHPAQPSLNLAQAVLLLAYELRLQFLADGAPPAVGEARASSGDVEQALGELRDGLLAIGYLDALNPEHILSELRGLVARARPTPREVVLLRGLARQVAWAGRIARERSGTG